jgi:hypothetical protein
MTEGTRVVALDNVYGITPGTEGTVTTAPKNSRNRMAYVKWDGMESVLTMRPQEVRDAVSTRATPSKEVATAA